MYTFYQTNTVLHYILEWQITSTVGYMNINMWKRDHFVSDINVFIWSIMNGILKLNMR